MTSCKHLFNNSVFKEYVYVRLCWVCGHERESQQSPGAPGPLELKLQGSRDHLRWVLGTELGSSAGTARAINF